MSSIKSSSICSRVLMLSTCFSKVRDACYQGFPQLGQGALTFRFHSAAVLAVIQARQLIQRPEYFTPCGCPSFT